MRNFLPRAWLTFLQTRSISLCGHQKQLNKIPCNHGIQFLYIYRIFCCHAFAAQPSIVMENQKSQPPYWKLYFLCRVESAFYITALAFNRGGFFRGPRAFYTGKSI